ncbi:FAD-dependent monooxygenase [Zafaria sp. Z1313]|uniref:FAD-dependent monooxygenase n=1 Tax=unclassified Zafaria TaxID=2828765 RepID=UPI002E75F12F|nr:FAD-dependent monooxygenase [Zafaria sp. J156]MEE1621775.1 FAD-dependent monooxygenase [Zafaria sp. J156]
MDLTVLDVDVCVVGAGPTGLMAANVLEKLGVDAVVVDSKAGPTRESRALGLQARSVELYRQLGLAEEVLARRTLAAQLLPGVGPRSLGAVPLGRMGAAATAFPGIHILEQSANEEILAARLERRGRPVLWRHGFERLEQDDGGARVHLAGPDGPVRVGARYVIACDGAASPVRRQLGIGFPGGTNRHLFYVIDANAVTGLRDGISVRVTRDEFMLAFPMGPDGAGGRRVRLLGLLPAVAEDDAGAPPRVAEGRARSSLARGFGIHYGSSEWFSTYRVHHRVADVFRDGRVFLAGDAAHIHSPVGAQGMNTGLQDAHNLACKLADVLAGRMPEASLDRYQAERRPVALRLVSTTDRVFGVVTSPHPAAVFFRTRIAPVLMPVVARVVPRSPAGGRLFGYVSQLRIHYWMTEAERRRAESLRGPARAGRRGRVLGRRLPWVPLDGAEPDNHASLDALEWQVHAYGGSGVVPGRRLAERHGLPLREFPAAPRAGLPDGTAVVVRPDLFVAALERAATKRG